MAASHTLQETEDWFDKVTVSRNMKELTNHSKQFSKIAEEASSVQQRLAGLYEDMGSILNRYYDIPETHIPGHDDDDRDIRDKEEYGGNYTKILNSAIKLMTIMQIILSIDFILFSVDGHFHDVPAYKDGDTQTLTAH